jgi:CheY-like chemotaxis protein
MFSVIKTREKVMSEEILFVDDEDLILDIAEAIFEQQGIPILTARSGEEALDIMKKTRLPSSYPTITCRA